MSADGSRAEGQHFGDLLHRLSLRQREKDLEFLLAQGVERIARARELLDRELLGDLRLEKGLPLADLADGLDQRLGSTALREIADCAGLEDAPSVHRVLVRRQDEDPRRGLPGEDAANRLQAT